MKQFGRTWWGQQWLTALDGIDENNRLPRGRRYANNGSVRSIEIDDESVQARVRGSRSTPYKIALALTPFTKRQRQTVLETVESSPVLLSRLLNRQLPPHVLALLEDKKIGVFPSSWRDIKASCSCPDFALPCKHIAAVFYLIANEIDKNPFLVFELRGLDLAEALQTRAGVQIDTVTVLPALSDDWSRKPAVADFNPPAIDAFAEIDLGRVPALESRIFTILSPEPLFHGKDFHRILASHYQRARRAARAFDRDPETSWPEAEQLETLTGVLDDGGALIEMRAGGKPFVKGTDRDDVGDQFEAFLASLHALPADRETRLAHNVLLWRALLRFALKLIEQGAHVPQALTNTDGETLIQWQPARQDGTVKELFEQFCNLCPPDLVVLRSRDGRRHSQAYGNAPTQISAALHLLLGLFVRLGFEATTDATTDDPIRQLFFTGRSMRFDHFETGETPRLIGHWLRRLTLGERAHRLHLRVDEQDDDRLTVTLAVESKTGQQGIADWLARTKESEAKAAALADLAVLAEYFPDVERLYATEETNRQGGETLVYTLETFTPVFRDVLPALRMLGIGVALPKALHRLVRPQAGLSISSSGTEAAVSYLTLDQLLEFDWQVAIGDRRLSVEEFRQQMANASGLVRLRDQYVMVDAGEVRRLLDQLEKSPAELSRAELLQAGLSGEIDGAAVTVGEDARALFDQLIQPEAPPPLPESLNARLRPYQQRGFEWLAQNARLGFGSLLADDMGLGKTLQVIAWLLHLKKTGKLDKTPALVVMPTSLLTNWRHEIERFAPALSVQVFHGAGRKLKLDGLDAVLTSYGLVRSDAKTLAKPQWAAVVIDEAQNIKNPATAQSKAIKRLKADIRVALSGTPVENRLREYWSVFDFINPGYLKSQKRFAETLANPIERDRDQIALEKFRRITAPFILRRLKTDKTIIADLPDKIETNRYCALTAEQASLYQSTVDTIMAELTEGAEGVERRGIIFKLLNALKQICNSPAQYLNRDRADIDDSGKLATFVEIMREIDATDEKALIFTQYTAMGELLVGTLREVLGVEISFLHGGRTRKQRDDMVAAFQSDRGTRAMVVSLKAGGTGLNLTAASQVIHYDLWWNPAVERQATDRAYRIGQHRNVTVHRLITENTFEEKIDAMIQNKKELADITVANGEKWISELSNAELRELVSL